MLNEKGTIKYSSNIQELYYIILTICGVYMSTADQCRDGYLFIFAVFGFMILLGIKESIFGVYSFTTNYKFYTALTMIWIIYFSINNTDIYLSNRFPLSVFFLIFGGFFIARMEKNSLIRTLKHELILLLVLEIIGIVNYIFTYTPGLRMSFAFNNAILEGDAIIYMLMLGLFFAEESRIKIITLVVSFFAVIATNNRMTLIEYVFILGVYIIIKRKEIRQLINRDIRKTRIIMSVIGGMVVVFAVMFRNVIAITLLTLGNRVLSISITDASIYYRLFAAKSVLGFVPDGNLMQILFGRGCLQGYYRLIDYASNMGDFGTQIGPVENTFISIMYDYGILGFALYVSVFLSALYSILKKDSDILLKKISCLVIVIMFTSAFVDMQYWLNLCPILFTTIGLYLGTIHYKKKCLSDNV